MSKLYSRLKRSLSKFLKKVYKLEIEGVENEPETGPYIVCANHISNHDVIILGITLKNQMRFFAKAELFRIPLLKQLITSLGAFPVQRGKGDVGAIKNTIKMLNEGEVVGYFPQGHRFPKVNPKETEAKSGVGLIAAKAKVPILPVTIIAKKYKIHLFRKTKIIIGKPIPFEEFLPLENNKSDYDKITKIVFDEICSKAEDNPFEKKNKEKSDEN